MKIAGAIPTDAEESNNKVKNAVYGTNTNYILFKVIKTNRNNGI